jgi:hypothetical protein
VTPGSKHGGNRAQEPEPGVDQYGVPVRDLRKLARRDEPQVLVYVDGQDQDDVEIQAHLLKHRQKVKQTRSVLKMQSFWRMVIYARRFRCVSRPCCSGLLAQGVCVRLDSWCPHHTGSIASAPAP